MEGNHLLRSTRFQNIFTSCCSFLSTFKKLTISFSFLCILTGETKHNIDKLVDDLKHAVSLEASQNENENSNIVQILDSVVNVSKTSIGGIMERLYYTYSLVLNLYDYPYIYYFSWFFIKLYDLIIYYVKIITKE